MTIGTEDVCPECGHYFYMCKHAEMARIAELEAERASLRQQLAEANEDAARLEMVASALLMIIGVDPADNPDVAAHRARVEAKHE
jgi:uncharacterized Zn finger protein (UPF0148 family)